jgi:hypothetical protein
MARPPIERFWSKVQKQPNGGCWLWIGAIVHGGYGQFSCGGRLYRAHRWIYEWVVGPIPAGLQIDHTCNVRNCVNPLHLDVVTNQENIRRALARGGAVGVWQLRKTHCPKGHPYSGANLHFRSNGHRVCGECNNARSRKRPPGPKEKGTAG